VMPAYPWLFDAGPDRPTQEGRDLVAYLDSLGRAREIAGPEGEAAAREACRCTDDELRQMAFSGPLNMHPAKTRRAHDAPVLPAQADPALGLRLYADHCASCHGPQGDGNGPGAPTLRPRPANLVEHEYTDERMADILWNGVWGTAMPAWRDRPLEDLAALAQMVGNFSASAPDAALPDALPGALPAALPDALPGGLPDLPDDLSDNLEELGARVYGANCVQCHGEQGDGNGSAAAELPMDPTNFRRQRPSLAEGLRALRNGVDGTPMAPWTSRLSEAEMLAAAQYVRRFYGEAVQ